MTRFKAKLLAGTMAFAALGGWATIAAAEDAITVATYGGEWGAAMQACIIDPFTRDTGVRVTPEPGVSGVTLSKLRQQKDAPTLDAVWIDGGVSEIAAADGVVAAVDPAKVAAAAGMIPEGVYKGADGKIFALSTGFYSLGLAYNTREIKQAPASWLDLWKPEFAGAVTFPSPSNAMGVPFIVHLAGLLGGNVDNVTPAFEKLKQLKVSAYFDTAGAGTNLFQSSEVIIGAHYASSAYAMRDQKLPVEFVVPKEGAIGGDIRLHLVANSKKQALAEKFMNYAVGTGPAKCMAEKIYVGPATSGVELSDNAKQRMPWGPAGSIKSLALPDWNKINANRAAIIEAFNKTVVAKR
jgi:putative spermidine/putrescine transport system substrate-binding protein